MESPTSTEKARNESFGTPSSNVTNKNGILVTPGGATCESDSEKGSTHAANGNVKEPHENDVLCGRGGSINSHPGNERFRDLVERRKRVYLTARFKREKRLIANSIVSEIRALSPPGHFLTRDSKSGLWFDIGDEKARDKTSQALRENAPSIRAEIEVEIHHQRAEMKRVEEDEAAHVVQHYGPPPPHYYPQPWGYYPAYPSYGHYPSPAGHEPYRGYSHSPSEQHAHSPHYQQSFSYEECSHVSATHVRSPTSSVTSRRGGSHGHYSTPSPRSSRHSDSQQSHIPSSRSHSSHSDDNHSKSAFTEIPKFVTSVPSSIAAWTKTSFSFGGNNSGSSDGHDRPARPQIKPLAYTHQPLEMHPSDHRDGSRRMVTFEVDRRHAMHPKAHTTTRPNSGRYGPAKVSSSFPEPQGNAYTPIRHSNSNTNSITPDTDGKSQALEPRGSTQPFESVDEHPSLLSQFATNFLGSWDGMGVCANDSRDGNHDGSMWTLHRGSVDSTNQHAAEVSREEEYGATEEGQEVELLEMMDCDDEIAGPDDQMMDMDDEARTPPPAPPRRIEIDWPSKMMGCQTQWLPDTFDPPSFFSPRNDEVNSLAQSASLEMEQSAVGTEGFSTNGSIGGGSLCRVFTHDQIEADANAELPMSPVGSFNHHMLGPIPSWERSFRSSSTVCSEDDGSILSRRSDKISSPITIPLSPRLQHFVGESTMAWDQQAMRRE